MIRYSLLLLIAIILLGCDLLIPERKMDTTYDRSIIPYEIQNPDEIVILPHELEEVSGLAFYKDNQLLTINDEEGKVYILAENGKIADELRFDKGDDYEGITRAEEKVYVLKANGDIHQIGKRDGRYNTVLKLKNNSEGLAFNPSTNSLLIACKGEAGIEEDITGKAIYSFSLESLKVDPSPFLIIDINKVNDHIQQRDPDFDVLEFGPSGIAVNPVNDYIYILAYRGKAIAVYNQAKELLEVVKLTHDRFKQPEGICFSPDGSKLYIANEGRGGHPSLMIFSKKDN